VSNIFKLHLASWATKENITLKAMDGLLKILKRHGGHDYLPSSSRTLLKTPRTTYIKSVGAQGSYWHYGLELGLFTFLEKSKSYHLENESINLMFNIDGLPLSHSSYNEIWPILGSIFKVNYVFVIGIYHSQVKKPTDIYAYLEDFIKEVNNLILNGFTYEEKSLAVRVHCFCADVPAKASMLCIKGHSGYNSCTKCNVRGYHKERRTCFPVIIGEKRTDQSFKEHIDYEYHSKDQNGILIQSPLENIIGFGMVTNVPLDYQHLLCLGIVKKLISIWWAGDLRHRVPLRFRKLVSFKLLGIRNNTPQEFQRKPRSLKYYMQFKATEFRQILLYTGVFVLKRCLSNEKYNNFLTLHVAITILSSPFLITFHLEYARKLIHHFLTTFKFIYGSHMISHNFHSLLHLSDDAEKFGILDNFSCFKFENFMMQIKKLVRNFNRPLQQIARRIEEVTKNATLDFEYITSCDKIIYSGDNINGPVLSGCEPPAYKKLRFHNFIIIAGDIRNNCCSVNEGKTIVRVENILMYNNCHVIIGYEYTAQQNLYSIPGLESSIINIYEVGSLSVILKMWPVEDIKCKFYAYETMSSDGSWAVFPILHTWENEKPLM